MKQNIHCICLILIFFILSLFSVPALKKMGSKEVIERYYAHVSGFGIPQDDEKNIVRHGGAPTYGEMTTEGAERLIAYLKPQKHDVFVDAGSGVGKLVVQVFFATDVAKSIGIELSQERYNKAMAIRQALEKDGMLSNNRSLEFYHADIVDALPRDTTIFFMCSTCFSPELMQKITTALTTLKTDVRVVTLKHLPNTQDFRLQDTLHLPMTWSSSTAVYIYERVAPHVQ